MDNAKRTIIRRQSGFWLPIPISRSSCRNTSICTMHRRFVVTNKSGSHRAAIQMQMLVWYEEWLECRMYKTH